MEATFDYRLYTKATQIKIQLHGICGQFQIELGIWDEIFLPLNIWVIYLGDIQTDCTTHKECISEVHNTICK